MATSSEPIVKHDPDPVRVVRQFSAIPPWLAAALDADQVMMALNRHVPEFASGALTLRDCAIDQLHLKDTKGEWGRNWMLTVADADGERTHPYAGDVDRARAACHRPAGDNLAAQVERLAVLAAGGWAAV